jgi:hypothetical protein
VKFPSDKVMTTALMALAAALVSALAADTSIMQPLPDWAEAIAVGAVAGLAGYFKTETNPSI